MTERADNGLDDGAGEDGADDRADDRADEDGADDRADWTTEWADDVEPNRYHRLHRQARIATEKELSSAA